jgi:hypothetical protein
VGITDEERERVKNAAQEEARIRAGYESSGNGDAPMPDYLTRELTPIYPNGLERREVVSATLQALVKGNDPERVFAHGGSLSRLLVDENERVRLEPMDHDALGVEVMHVASFRGKSSVRDAPKYVLPALRKLGRYPGLPPIEAIVEAPVLRTDGRVLSAPGYDAASRLYYHPREGLSVPVIPEAPTQAQARAAIEHARFEVLND